MGERELCFSLILEPIVYCVLRMAELWVVLVYSLVAPFSGIEDWAA